jgi:hypothetical protein
MVGLLSLSNELLIGIYSVAATLQSAVDISATNKRLCAGWLGHSNQIIAGILTTIPAYEDATVTMSIGMIGSGLTTFWTPFI